MGYSNSFFLYQFWFCMLCRLYIVNCFFPFRWKPDYLTALFTPHVVMVTIVSVFVFVIVAIGLSYYCYRVKPSHHLWWKGSWPDSFSCERRTKLLRRTRVQSAGMARRMDRWFLFHFINKISSRSWYVCLFVRSFISYFWGGQDTLKNHDVIYEQRPTAFYRQHKVLSKHCLQPNH